MSRQPERAHPKAQLQVQMHTDAYRQAHELLVLPGLAFRSFSKLAETLLFWMRSIYIAWPDGKLAEAMCHVRVYSFASTQDFTVRPKRRKVHMTIDEEALAFLTMLADHYPGLFESRDDAFELVILFALFRLHRDGDERMTARLVDIQRQHPPRARSHPQQRV